VRAAVFASGKAQYILCAKKKVVLVLAVTRQAQAQSELIFYASISVAFPGPKMRVHPVPTDAGV
jgi:hypothetical protein